MKTSYNSNSNRNSNKSYAPKPENKTNYNNQNKKKTTNSKYRFTPTTSGSPKYTKSSSQKDFFGAMERTINSMYNFSITENGAVGLSSTGSNLLDMNFKLSSYRHMKEDEIIADFVKAFNENPVLAMRELFYFRDVREGQGERRIFRICMKSLANNGQSILVDKLIPLMGTYGRYDDMLELLDTPSKYATLKFISQQWNSDLTMMGEGKPISLMAKWVPSSQASNQDKKRYAAMITKYLKLTPRQYRKALSAMREHIDVIERKMSSDNWESINYETVPSKANLLYSKAFLRHDMERRNAFLEALSKGEAKINSSVAFPHEITYKYMNMHGWNDSIKDYDETLEGMWKNLPSILLNSKTIVVGDGSGSMTVQVDPHSNVRAIDVMIALSIYCAEHLPGAFHNKCITFSEVPKIVNLPGTSLRDNMLEMFKHCQVANTNIEAVYDLILNTAIQNNMSQDELPDNILITSDMEFDACVESNHYHIGYGAINRTKYNSTMKTLFDTIKEKFEAAGYKMPKTIFWNLNSRTGTIPMKENDMGCILVSGFSINTLKMVMSDELDPYKALVEIIDGERYDAVENAVHDAFTAQARALKKAQSYSAPNKSKSKNKNTRSQNSRNSSRSINSQQVRNNLNQYKSKA